MKHPTQQALQEAHRKIRELTADAGILPVDPDLVEWLREFGNAVCDVIDANLTEYMPALQDGSRADVAPHEFVPMVAGIPIPPPDAACARCGETQDHENHQLDVDQGGE